MPETRTIERCDYNRFAAQHAARVADTAPAIVQENSPVAPTPTPTPIGIVHAALASGNLDMYRDALAFAKELDAIAARKAFDAAMAAAKAKLTVIRKNRRAGFDSRKAGGARTEYAYEDLGEIARTIDPVLGEHGLSYRFRVASELNQPVRVTCIISHRDGHSEETTLHAGRDESGSKNAIQAIGSTVTYLQRYTLKAALGLAASYDDDGHASEVAHDADGVVIEDEQPSGVITRDQVERLQGALRAKGANPRSFLQWAKQKRFEDIPVAHFESCMNAINNFRSVQR